MERDLYPRRWGLGPVALQKKKLKADGKPDKFGRPNNTTPSKWTEEYKVFSEHVPDGAPPVEADSGGPPDSAVLPYHAAHPKTAEDEEEVEESKKRKKHEGETPEERYVPANVSKTKMS